MLCSDRVMVLVCGHGRRHYLQGTQTWLFPFLRVTNPDLLKEVKDSEPSFRAATDGAAQVGCGWT